MCWDNKLHRLKLLLKKADIEMHVSISLNWKKKKMFQKGHVQTDLQTQFRDGL